MNPPELFELTKQERAMPLWIKLSEHFEERIRELREQNDSTQLDEKHTAKIRAEIALYKELLKL